MNLKNNSMNFLSNKSVVRSILAFVVVVACIIGFFMGLIQSEFFTGIVSLVIGNYFEGQNTERVQQQLDNAQVEIQQLRHTEPIILSEKDVEKKVR